LKAANTSLQVDLSDDKMRSEELKRDLTKKLSSIYRDLEKM
jgi:hypothetical protein